MIEMLNQAVAEGGTIDVSSPAFDDGDRMPDWTGYTNEGENPELVIDGVPDEAESLLLVCIHPEAAEVVDHPWLHWLAWDIDPETATIERDWDGAGTTEGVNDFLERGYGGPSPPVDAEETYRFRVYALEHELGLPAETRYARVASTIGLENEILAAGELCGTYHADQGTVFATEGPSGLRP